MSYGSGNVSRYVVAYLFAAVVTCTLMACSHRQAVRPASIEATFNRFYEFEGRAYRGDPTTLALASRIRNRYRTDFSRYQTSDALRTVGNDDLVLLFRAADIAFFYTVSPFTLRDLQLDSAELHRRGVAREALDERLYAALIESRHFAEAQAFARLHPSLQGDSVARVSDRSRAAPTALLVRGRGATLERRSVDINKNRIVVVSSPLCHFSQHAVRSIEADQFLRERFRDHALWLVPPDESTTFSTVAKWNQVHPNEAMQFAYRREEWPMIDRWETPVFYFFRNGRVVAKVIGWPAAGRKAEIRRALRISRLVDL